MKILGVLLILVLLLPLGEARTKTFTFQRDQSELIENINVTLLDFDRKEDKVIVCVNNRKGIVSEDKRINGVYFEIKKYEGETVKMSLEGDCDECEVGDNLECYDECRVNEDCDDFNDETIDSCNGIPKQCVYVKKPAPKPNEPKVVEKPVNKTQEENKTREEVPEIEYFSFFKQLSLWVISWFR